MKKQNRIDGERTAADCVSVLTKKLDDSDKCTNHNHDDDGDDDYDERMNSQNAMVNINRQTDDVPDSQIIDQISLDEHENNAKQFTTNQTTDYETSHQNDDNDDDSANGDAHELNQIKCHRRLHTPVWARCSIKSNYNKQRQIVYFVFLFFGLNNSAKL